MAKSFREQLVAMDPDEAEAVLALCTDQEILEMARGEWWYTSRPEQVPSEGNWTVFLFCGGRGTGKTQAGSEWLVQRALDHPVDASGFPVDRLVVAYNVSDARTTCIEGSSGILRVLKRREIPYTYVQSPKPKITLDQSGTRIHFTGADSEDVGRGLNLADVWCVARGEPVITSSGVVAVEEVHVGDRVMTRQGWRTVRRSGVTGTSVEVLEIKTDSGSVRVTPEHLVMANGEWIQARFVKPGDTMIGWTNLTHQTPQPSMNGTEAPGTTTNAPVTTTTETDPCCTDVCGSQPTVRSRMDTKSITSTGNDGTTGLRTWNSSLSPSTGREPGASEPTPIAEIPRSVRNGCPGQCEPSGTTGGHKKNPATSAGTHSSAPECEPLDAPTNAEDWPAGSMRQTSVLSVSPAGLSDVFDISVSGEPEFFAGSGSLLIHNCDEIIKWADPGQIWKYGIHPALRANLPNDKPRAFVTTTPKPIPILQSWMKREDGFVSVSRGSTFDNSSNLSDDFLKEIRDAYEGTTVGRQELYGELIDDMEGPLFSMADIARFRVTAVPEEITHRVLGVDPSLKGAEDGDYMGVVVAARGVDKHAYVLADESIKAAGREAARHIWRVFSRYSCDVLAVEVNLGRQWLTAVLKDAYAEAVRDGLFPEHTSPPIKEIFSTHGKKLRAEPVSLRYQQGRVHHVGTFEKLEAQMVSFDPLTSKDSPDRLDALVHAVKHLMSGEGHQMRIFRPTERRINGF